MAEVDQVVPPTGGNTVAKVASVQQKRGTTATQRLKQDYMRIMKDPVPYVTAHPLPSNILEWYVSHSSQYFGNKGNLLLYSCHEWPVITLTLWPCFRDLVFLSFIVM